MNRALSKQRLAARDNISDTATTYTPPTEASFLACLHDTSTDQSVLTDNSIEDICRRYSQAARLACLYEMLSTELDLLHPRLITVDHLEDVTSCLDPGSVIPDLYPFTAERHYPSNPTFRSRFCKAVCLLVIVTSALSQARSSQFLTEEAGSSVYCKMLAVWTQHFEDVCEGTSPLSWRERLECMEVRDFLYTYLLSKIIPPQAIESWWADTKDYWIGGDSPNEPFQRQWNYTLQHFRQCLTLYDILDLVLGQSQDPSNAYPSDKTTYLYTLGIIEIGPFDDYDWFTEFGRCNLSQDVDPSHHVPQEYVEHPT